MIWFKDYTIKDLQSFSSQDNIVNLLGIEFTDIAPDSVTFRMAVDHRTHQIHGLLHGGATCVLSETVGSFASLMVVNPQTHYAVGSQITANHLRPIKTGYITATAKPVHLGRTKHVWDIPVYSDEGKMIAKTELTCAVIPKA